MDRPNYEKLNIWQDGMELVKQIYMLTKKFPRDEMHGLTSQIRRAAVSVPVNIAEGHGRETEYLEISAQILSLIRRTSSLMRNLVPPT